jgi:hypothetical protein
VREETEYGSEFRGVGPLDEAARIIEVAPVDPLSAGAHAFDVHDGQQPHVVVSSTSTA